MAKDSADKEQLDIATKLNQQRRDTLNLEVELRKETQIIVNSGKQIIEYSKLLADYKRSGNAEAAKESEYLAESYKIEADRARLAALTILRQKKLNKFVEKHGPLIENANDLQEKYNKELEKSKDTADELAKPFKSITKSLKSALGPIGGLFSDVFDKMDNDAVESIQKTITGKLSGTKGELDSAMSDLDSATKAAGLSAKDLGIEMGDTSKKAVELANSSGNIGTSMAESTGNSVGMLSKMKDGFGGIKTAGKAAFSGLISGASTLMATLMANPIFLVAAAVVAIGAAAYALFKRYEHVKDAGIDIARTQGLAADEANRFHKNIIGAQTDMSALGLVTSEMNKEKEEYALKLNDAMRSNLSMTQRNILLGALMQKNYGLTAEEAVDFAEATALSGQAADENLFSLEATVDRINHLTNMGLRYADVMKAIGKASKSILANYKFQIPLLTQAVAMAKQYGLSLTDTDSISNHMLDIETSIGEEMQARVLTGKNINFNEARLLSLQGKTSEAVDSMVKQMGSYEEMMDMAPYQQDALAKSIGMTRDQLITAVTQQGILSKLTGQQIGYLDTLSQKELETLDFAKMGLSEVQKNQILAARTQMKLSEIQESYYAKGNAYFDYMMTENDDMKDNYDSYGQKTRTTELEETRATATAKFTKDYGESGVLEMAKRYQKSGPVNTNPDGGAAVPDWFKPIGNWLGSFGRYGGTGEPEQNDFISRPGQAPISFNEDDIIIGATNPFGGSTSNNDESIAILKEQNALLEQLIAATSGPVHIKIGSRTIEELDSQLSLRKNYNIGADKTYNGR